MRVGDADHYVTEGRLQYYLHIKKQGTESKRNQHGIYEPYGRQRLLK